MNPQLGDVHGMHAEYLSGRTLLDVASGHGLCQQALSCLFKKHSLPVRLRGKFRVKPTIAQLTVDPSLESFRDQWDKLDSTVKGTISEGYVKNRLCELGFDVWEPVAQNHATDLIIVKQDSLLRIQVKSASYDGPRKRFRASLSRHRRSGEYVGYTEDLVDFFIVFCCGLPCLEFYVIPAALAKKSPSINLLPHREKRSIFSTFTWETYRNAFDLLR